MSRPNSERVRVVRRAVERWKNDLVDASGRNRLRRYRDLRSGTLDLTPNRAPGMDVQALQRLLAGKPVALNQLFPLNADDAHETTPFDDARRRMATIHRQALANREEKGIETCFAAMGLATWQEEQGVDPCAPVLLLPLLLEATGAAGRDFTVQISGDAHLNPVLVHALRSEFAIRIDEDEAELAEDPPVTPQAVRALFDRLKASCRHVPAFGLEARVVLTNFSYATMPLVSDLEENGELFAESDIVAAIAGDEQARNVLASRICEPAPNQPDFDQPADEFLTLDADSSQHRAINRVLGGESLVIQGPPGTGKSQTIANLISTLVARGKRVLFVAEKRAAIEAVTKRLEKVGLSDLVMDMHGGVASRREFARILSESLDRISKIPAPDYSQLHTRLRDRRHVLNENDAAVHQLREPWGMSVNEMRTRLLAVPEKGRISASLSSKAARRIDKDRFEKLQATINEWTDLGGHTLAEEHPEWSRSTVTSIDDARTAFDLVNSLVHKLSAVQGALFAALEEIGLASPATVAEWQQTIDFLTRIEQLRSQCHPAVYGVDHVPLLKALAPKEANRAAQIVGNLNQRGPEVEQSTYQLADRLAKETLPATSDAVFALLDEAGLVHPTNVTGWQQAVNLLAGVEQLLARFEPDIYQFDHPAIIRALAPARQSSLGRMLAQLFSANYRSAKRALRQSLRQPEALSSSDLLTLAEEAGAQAYQWDLWKAKDGVPLLATGIQGVEEQLDRLAQALDQLGKAGGIHDLHGHPHGELKDLLAILAAHGDARNVATSMLFDSSYLSPDAAVTLVEDARQQLAEWLQRSGSGEPRVPQELGTLREAIASLCSDLEVLMETLGTDHLLQMACDALAGLLNRLAGNSSLVASLPRIREIESRFRALQISPIMEQVGSSVPPAFAGHAVEHAWLRRVLIDLEFDDQRLSHFDSEGHSRCRDEFASADQEHILSTPHRVHRLAAEAVIAVMNSHQEETMLVRREAAKKRRHLSPRQLFARAPNVVTALRPCWTMSPVLAAEIVPADYAHFDVVIFDEASQIPPAEAIGSLARAPQAVIAGDSRQLPPTSFFGRESASDGDGDDAEDDTMSLTDDIESLLDASAVLLRHSMLEWHYRSRDDRLIAFSNNHIYGGALTAFPGAVTHSPISHCLIPFRPLPGVIGARSNPDEVEKVVDFVLEHASNSPDETLGVIAFGQHHASNIENALARRLGELNDASLDEFFAEANEERFFVKNIERVQGDERDVILMSIGYHKDASGRLAYRFGPINQEGGERRLNVAVTRARSRITLVSSFSHRDMDPDRSSAKGVQLLRQYLEYASSGGTDLGSTVPEVPLNAFELSIKEGLESRGIPVIPQYGVSGYRIDFACRHPDQEGRMVLAIEADGASYHSSHTARDRDRLRQDVLEGKGWSFHRIWSTAWFRDRERELDRAEQAWKRAVEASEAGVAAQPPTTAIHESISGNAVGDLPERSERPSVPRRGVWGYDSIEDYSTRQLVSLAQWIESDSLLRTDEQLLREMMRELGFKRSGWRISNTLQMAIRASRRKT